MNRPKRPSRGSPIPGSAWGGGGGGRRFANSQLLERNPDYDNPGAHDWQDENFDANEQTPYKLEEDKGNWFQRLFTSAPDNTTAIEASNKETEQKHLGELKIGQEQKSYENKLAADLEQIKQTQLIQNEAIARAVVPMLASQRNLGAIPTTVGGSYGDIGNFWKYNYGPNSEHYGAASALPMADAKSAEAKAQTVAFENARLADLARQENIPQISRHASNIDLRDAQIRENFSKTPQYETGMQYSIGQKLAPDITLGPMEERYNLLTGRKMTGPRMETQEKQEMVTLEGPDGRKMQIPGDTTRSSKYVPGSTTTHRNVVGNINDRAPKAANESSTDSGNSPQMLTDEEIINILRKRNLRNSIP